MAACEPLGIPAAFAPLFDLLDELPEDLQKDIRSGSGRPAVYAGMLDLIKNDRVVLVFEDVHWSDEATLGLVRYLGRRIGATNSSLVVSFRTEELDLNPALRLVVADLGPMATRIDLPALTLAGVLEMARDLDVDAQAIYAATMGNPFYVEEVMRHPDLDLPPTVQNAVLANAGQLSDDALEFLYTVALSPEGVSLDVLSDLGDPDGTYADLAFQRRLLVAAGGQIACRHELVRQSLVQALPPMTKRRLHQRLLGLLEKTATGSPDITRLAFHSIGAEESAKAMIYSLQAAQDAARAGAHRQAAFHYANSLEYADEMDLPTHMQALLDAAVEHNFINAFDVATALSRRRLDLVGSAVEKASARAWVSFFESRRNDLVATRAEAESAMEVLRGEAPCLELAIALSVLAWVDLVEGDWKTAVLLADEGAEEARACGSSGIQVYAATTAGTARWLLGEATGWTEVEEASTLGIASDAGEFAARAINNLGVLSLLRGRLEDARRSFDQLQEYATNHELDAWYIAAVTTMAWVNVASGRWDDADRDLEVVSGQKTCFQTEIEALQVSAVLRLRRGDPGAVEQAEAVFARLSEFNDHDAQVSGCLLALEGAWVGVLPAQDASERYDTLRTSPAIVEDRAGRAQLAFWAHRLDLEPPPGEVLGAPGLELSGRVAEAAARWEKRGFLIEAAITRAMIPGADLVAVFAELTSLGAEGVARGLRRELQRRGVKHVPRGERIATKDNPSGLTAREAEVLELIVAGHSNAAIAADLFISEKTASHHVSSVLSKLNVSSRGQASAVAVANGWFDSRTEPN